jgi:3'-phosphoadenosine 5'-phosphosulfate sulfotransferase (PAPS reductase)/FAD synthetase
MARKLVPLERRLGKLRKEEAKRRHQLEVVQARSERTKGQMATLIASVNEWVQNPAPAGDGSAVAR